MNVKVKEVMTKQVCFVKPNDTVGKVKRIFKKNNFNILPVVDSEGKMIGVVSQGDLLLVEGEFSQIHNHIQREVVTISEYENINEAAHLMRKKHIHHLIVTMNKQIVGIVSSYDLLKVLDDRVYKYVEKHKQKDAA